jgi:hypothetical protein
MRVGIPISDPAFGSFLAMALFDRRRTSAGRWVHTSLLESQFSDPHVQHLGIAAPLKTKLFRDTCFVVSPVNFHGMPRKLRCETPEPGQHNEEVLGWLEYSREKQTRFEAPE